MSRFKNILFRKRLCVPLLVFILAFVVLVFALIERSLVKPEEVSAAEIIQKQLEAILEKGTIYHHKVFSYSGLVPDTPQPQSTIYEIWDDQDSDRFKNEVSYSGDRKIIQAFDGDIRWDYDEEEKTLRKDIYIYPDPAEREIQHGDRLDLTKTYRELLENGILTAQEGELNGRKVWVVADEWELTLPTFWNRFYFEKESFTLLRQERWQKKEDGEVLIDRMDYEIIESISKEGLDVNEFFRFDYLLPEGTVVLERHFNFVSGYVEDDYYPATPSAIPKIPVSTPTSDSTANWETYRNTEYGFELKYPLEFQFVSEGPNSAQQALNKGEQISGTMQPSYDTIIFSENTNELIRIEIFHKYEKDLQEENYKEGYLYLFGPCDLRWGFEAKFLNFNFVNNIKMLTVKGKNGEGNSQNCYYLENLAGNLIVISNKEYKSEIFDLMLSTFKFLE